MRELPILGLGLLTFTLMHAANLPATAPGAARAGQVEPVRTSLPFDAAWRFSKGDSDGAAAPGFDDAAWTVVDVPHDWAIAGPFDQGNSAGGAGAFLPSGVAWYRKSFVLPAGSASRQVFVEFDGVMANSDVYLNGRLLGHRPYGYVSFRYELTGALHADDRLPNVLAVRTDTSQQPASRWYAGAGIYRHVRLVLTNPVHLDQWGTFVSTPKVAAEAATVQVRDTVVNQSAAPRAVTVHVALVAPDGKTIQESDSAPQTIAPGQTVDFTQSLIVARPQLWELDHPRLYHAIAQVRDSTVVLDDDTVPFGIRDAYFEAATGFWLNGNNLKLIGVCLHTDGGAFGAAVPLGVWEHRLAALRAIGVNAIRTAHNPPDPGFLDLCDRMGFLVIDEMFDCWTVSKSRYDYHLDFTAWSQPDTRDTVRRDRNHPSVILYSAGNEIRDTARPAVALPILSGLMAVFHANDPTRPVTMDLFRPATTHDFSNGFADLLDVIGTGYHDADLLAAWRANPDRKILGTEQGRDRAAWLNMRDTAPEAGQFYWAGIDYLGESPAWPAVAAGYGLLDRTGEPRGVAYEWQSWWSDRPMVRLARGLSLNNRPATAADAVMSRSTMLNQVLNWSPATSGPHLETVEVFSNCESVELFLNNQSLGAKPLPADGTPRAWSVNYAPGTLKAVGSNAMVVVATDELRSAGQAAKLLLTADHAKLAPGWDQVAFVTATVVDTAGVRVPDAAQLISFKLTGPGAIAAVDNASDDSHEPFQAGSRSAFQGRCVAILRATANTGRITLTASAPGLASDSITIEAASP